MEPPVVAPAPAQGKKHHLIVIFQVLMNLPEDQFQQHGSAEAMAAEHGITETEAKTLRLQLLKARGELGRPCTSCGSRLHRNNSDPRCPNHADRVLRRQRRIGDVGLRMDARNPDAATICASCGQQGHATAHSPLCPNHECTNREFKRAHMPTSSTFTRVYSFHRLIQPPLRNILKARLRQADLYVRKVLNRLQLFLVDYLLHFPNDAPAVIFTHNGLYQVSKIVRCKMGTGPAGTRNNPLRAIPQSMLDHWPTFARDMGWPTTRYDDQKLTSVLTEECKVQANANRLHVSDLMEKRIKAYAEFRVRATRDEVPPKRVMNLIKSVVWAQFCSANVLMTEGLAALENVEEDDERDDAEDQHGDNDDDDDNDENDDAGADHEEDDVDVEALHPITPADFPPSIAVDLHGIVMAILRELAAIKPAQLRNVTPTILRRRPQDTIAVYVALLRCYDTYKRDNPLSEVFVPTFNLLPMISNRHRFITLNIATIPAILQRRYIPHDVPAMPNPDDERQFYPKALCAAPIFAWFLNLTVIGYETAQQLKTGAVYDRLFSGVIKSNGVQAHITFSRHSSRPKPPTLKDIDLQGLAAEGFSPCGVDPGRRTYLTSSHHPSVGDHDDPLAARATRKVSAPEYQATSGEVNRALSREARKKQRLPRQQGTMEDLETRIPEHRTGDIASFRAFIRNKITNEDTMNVFYGSPIETQHRFKAYQGRQRAIAHAANTTTTGGRKYRKEARIKKKTRRNRRRRHRKALARQAARGAAFVTLQAQTIEIEAAIEAIDVTIRGQQERHALLGDQAPAIARQQQELADQERSVLNSRLAENQEARRRLETRDQQQPQRALKAQFSGKQPTIEGIPLVGWGNGLLKKESNKIKGHTVGRSSMILQNLHQRQACGQLLVTHVDEYLTSKTCHRCHRRISTLPVVDGNQTRQVFASVFCPGCGHIFGRDENAADNMLTIVCDRVLNNRRPAALTRPARQRQPGPNQAPTNTTGLGRQATAALPAMDNEEAMPDVPTTTTRMRPRSPSPPLRRSTRRRTRPDRYTPGDT